MNSAVVTTGSVTTDFKTTDSKTTDSGAGGVSWTVEAAGLWVGRSDGTCVGVIEEKWRDGFVARDAAARRVGHFKTLTAAKAPFAASASSVVR